MSQAIPRVEPSPWIGASIALARVLGGLLWLSQLSWKLPPDFGCTPNHHGLCYWMGQMVDNTIFPPQGYLVKNLVLPHYHLFGWLVFGLEAITGVLLVLGLFTRLGALLGLLESINLGLGIAFAPGEWYWSYLLMIVLHLLLLAVAAGRYYGLDALIRERLAVERNPSTTARLLELVS